MATTIINPQEKLKARMIRQIVLTGRFLPDKKEKQSTDDEAPNRSRAISPRTISGYFSSRREMQLAKAESLAG